ncbi:ParB/RepB/Spo0J family partition protein [Pseudokineococcus lusitanus]|uniref:ParB/RepB/Spo0J family partition protein n=1 Tax=Pseudokineococcus lusitanus TaxID=763993 RepID=A0A3N1HTX9_9ACTN|nr:ParB N-terminal domain-containing protein [Pseudokineococcus lusitanus]ROP45927.1 ParB/RepB/Spo0J family partition protein [Pseudokineococcus lusitanus]
MTGERVALVRLDQVDFHPHNIRRDLGDLRALSDSLLVYGLQSPISVERWGERLRLRAGHRRVAAARMAGIPRLTAVIHPEPLPLREWLEASVQENVHRAGVDAAERAHTVRRLRELKATWPEIAAVFGVSVGTVQRYAAGEADDLAPGSAVLVDVEDQAPDGAAPAPHLSAARPAAATPKPPRPRTTVSTRLLVEVLDRWADAAPSALINELHALAETGRLPQQPTPDHDDARSTR